MGKITAPVLINSGHITSNFDCSEASLNGWLRKHALKNAVSGASQTFVVCQKKEVIGYYSLATGSVSRNQASGKIRRRMPEPIPIIVLGRLAVDSKWQNMGVGAGLLKDALLRVLSVSQQVGVRALLVQALNEKAKEFYLRHGFEPSPVDSMTLMLSLKGMTRKTH